MSAFYKLCSKLGYLCPLYNTVRLKLNILLFEVLWMKLVMSWSLKHLILVIAFLFTMSNDSFTAIDLSYAGPPSRWDILGPLKSTESWYFVVWSSMNVTCHCRLLDNFYVRYWIQIYHEKWQFSRHWLLSGWSYMLWARFRQLKCLKVWSNII